MLTINDFRAVTGLKITTEHTGKMAGVWSLSTSCKCNSNCKKYAQVEGSICEKCYAQKQLVRYHAQADCLTTNYEILTSRLLTADEMPLLTCLFFRFESFGDLENDTQLINYFNIADANPDVYCALWTKNYHIVERVIESGYKKPDNLNIVVSSLFINDEYNADNFEYADKVFSVFDKEHATDINCGSRCCATCQKCYRKNDIVYIRELLK